MLTGWSMDLRCNGAQTVLKAVRMSASYMAQKQLRAGVCVPVEVQLAAVHGDHAFARHPNPQVLSPDFR